MTESPPPAGPDRSSLLTPTSRAVAGLALAVAALLGTNGFTFAGQTLLMAGPEPGDPGVMAVGVGLFAAVPALLALLLSSAEARGPATTWPAHLSRAAVLVAAAALVAAVLMVVGGFLQF